MNLAPGVTPLDYYEAVKRLSFPARARVETGLFLDAAVQFFGDPKNRNLKSIAQFPKTYRQARRFINAMCDFLVAAKESK